MDCSTLGFESEMHFSETSNCSTYPLNVYEIRAKVRECKRLCTIIRQYGNVTTSVAHGCPADGTSCSTNNSSFGGRQNRTFVFVRSFVRFRIIDKNCARCLHGQLYTNIIDCYDITVLCFDNETERGVEQNGWIARDFGPWTWRVTVATTMGVKVYAFYANTCFAAHRTQP